MREGAELECFRAVAAERQKWEAREERALIQQQLLEMAQLSPRVRLTEGDASYPGGYQHQPSSCPVAVADPSASAGSQDHSTPAALLRSVQRSSEAASLPTDVPQEVGAVGETTGTQVHHQAGISQASGALPPPPRVELTTTEGATLPPTAWLTQQQIRPLPKYAGELEGVDGLEGSV